MRARSVDFPEPFGPVTTRKLPGPHLEVEVAQDALGAEPPSKSARRDHTTTSRSTKTKNVTLMTPFMVKNAMSSRFQSLGETSECS